MNMLSTALIGVIVLIAMLAIAASIHFVFPWLEGHIGPRRTAAVAGALVGLLAGALASTLK